MRFGGEKGAEDPVDVFWRDTNAGILDRDKHPRTAVRLGFDAQNSVPIGHSFHGIDGISHEVEQHVL